MNEATCRCACHCQELADCAGALALGLVLDAKIALAKAERSGPPLVWADDLIEAASACPKCRNVHSIAIVAGRMRER